MHILLLDNFDSFTYNLLDYLQQAGVTVDVRRNNVPVEELEEQHFDGIVLSPGPGVPGQAGCMMRVIAQYHQRVPMLGVCLGHQAVGQFFGASVVRAARPMHGKVSEMRCVVDDPLFTNLPRQLTVTRYHSLTLNNLPSALLPLAYTNDEHNELMALRHRTLPLYGVQFHPEALLTTEGLSLLRNWVNYCIIAKDAREASIHPTLSV
ncbi:aminodeoxychorismate/anthranilate synthase component II [Hymenobacter sp. GOD-10R]|uniref:anthranilate synthase component II n=1 Tax=Hymenobacter sp. GOD-10R TaxID=3093922 RepID=UPI002D7A12E4|nr:aminodeoxychorismate/anthranilate synthase component II [Hymenobacter sp. GOD-10R]WRQ27855.1 aminodeoxychorismate/anthranilate synthase component II [Hymenobacter sp. GOD-10R]